MALAVTCTSCKASLRVKEEMAGKRARCPKCQGTFEIPAAAAEAPFKVQEPAPLLAKKVSKATATQPNGAEGKPAPARANEPERKPPPKRPKPPSAEVMREIVTGFEGTIPRVRTTLFYHLGMLLVAVTLVLLVVVYLALIAGVAYFVYWHAVHNVWLMTSSGMLRGRGAVVLRVVAYIGPLFAGVILVLFMIKPLFARAHQAGKPRTLEFSKEPVIFGLVACIAKAVGAPEPKRIDVDEAVNASAHLDGVIGGVLGGRLVLTIGLPLVAGLTANQLAGVIAHELGHFAQGAGIRLSYFIRTINGWFGQVVYGRDEWDEQIDDWAREWGWLGLILLLASFCVGVTRWILWLFMAFGHGVSSFLMREMEYDADRYEIRLAGSKVFAQTSRKMMTLGIVAEAMFPALVAAWGKKPLPEDLASVIAENAERIPPADLQRMEKKRLKKGTGIFDSHPSDRDRLASARKENAPGIFHFDQPATVLFKDFSKLSRNVSKSFYRSVIGRIIEEQELYLTTDEISRIVG